ncbi:Photosystem I PsaG/PsaK protein [Sesbania bispinosa]|nr:Photosystem I PsaG/PsaK protein [Sesbania bispinosa]
MAASASSMISTPALSPTIQKHQNHLKPSNLCFQGLRPLTRSTASTKVSTFTPIKRVARGVVKAELNPSLVISLSTGLSLFLGRFVFFNFQRENVAKQGLPEQNGVTHFEAGDTRAKEYVSLLKSNDPVGFNLVDVLAWGSIGHIVAYYILATTSNGYDPKFFG